MLDFPTPVSWQKQQQKQIIIGPCSRVNSLVDVLSESATTKLKLFKCNITLKLHYNTVVIECQLQ